MENERVMELITTAHCWQIINKIPRMNRIACSETVQSNGPQNYLLPVIPNVIGHQAYWFIGKIRMGLVAGGAPVVVKRRAVNRSTKVRTSL
jgi:hypothetical protein